MAKPYDVLTLCRNAAHVSDEELAELEKVANEQVNYMHPLKHGTQAKQNALGRYNLRVIAAVRNLRDLIVAGPESDDQS